ncbi:amidohydrolase family protein [Bacillus alveayuensis]|uniref:amidohydrolase family protein n=1 Tax=Aeribacillus alveayuensis TaxID=279215 RepID=UPI0005CD58BC|nr:amidohydrolase family protein [Bacillus alveayuensis]
MYDFHTHFIPENVIEWVKEQKETIHAQWVKKEENKEEFLMINHKWGFELKKTFVDINLYIEEQSKAGIKHSVISPIPQLFMYDFPEEITYELSTVYNDSLVKLVQFFPAKLSALATVPLNNPNQAAQVLNDAMKCGLKGAIIGPGASGHMLSDKRFIPFFEEANRLKAIVFIHPLLSEDPRLKRRMMPNLIGVPWETTVCATDILLSGLIDRFPNVKILFAHGGGFLPYQIGRMTKGYEKWPAVSKNLTAPPKEYLKRFWYDNVLWDQQSVEFLIQTVGEDRVVPGSDFPFDLSVWPPDSRSCRSVRTILAD